MEGADYEAIGFLKIVKGADYLSDDSEMDKFSFMVMIRRILQCQLSTKWNPSEISKRLQNAGFKVADDTIEKLEKAILSGSETTVLNYPDSQKVRNSANYDEIEKHLLENLQEKQKSKFRRFRKL